MRTLLIEPAEGRGQRFIHDSMIFTVENMKEVVDSRDRLWRTGYPVENERVFIIL